MRSAHNYAIWCVSQCSPAITAVKQSAEELCKQPCLGSPAPRMGHGLRSRFPGIWPRTKPSQARAAMPDRRSRAERSAPSGSSARLQVLPSLNPDTLRSVDRRGLDPPEKDPPPHVLAPHRRAIDLKSAGRHCPGCAGRPQGKRSGRLNAVVRSRARRPRAVTSIGDPRTGSRCGFRQVLTSGITMQSYAASNRGARRASSTLAANLQEKYARILAGY